MAVKRKLSSITSDSHMDTPVLEIAKSIRPRSLAQKFAPLMYIAMLIMSFAIGALWQKVNYLEKGVGTVAQAPTGQGTTAGAQATPAPVTMEQIKDLFSKDLLKFGDANKKVLFVEVADPSCPYCHIAAGKNPELNKQAGTQFLLKADGGTYVAPVTEMKKLVDSGKASYVYVYTSGHGNGEMGQKAMYCAYEKGKFWEVHDLLYSNKGYDLLNNTIKNDKSKSQDLADFLKTAIDASFMKSCLESGRYDSRISSDSAIAQSLGVFGTPGFFVNTNRFGGAYSYTDMESVVNSAL